MRYSPAGVPIAEAAILHRGDLDVSGRERKLECELTIQASGVLASYLARLQAGDKVELEGALNRRSVYSRQLILIVNRIGKE